MRATYNSDGNYRTYPAHLYAGEFFGPEITEETVFDEVQIIVNPNLSIIGKTYLYSQGVKVTQVPARFVGASAVSPDVHHYLRDDPEVLIVRKAIQAGTCSRKFISVEYSVDGVRNEYAPGEFHSSHWLVDLLHPFHADDRDLFFLHLTEDLSYTAPEHGEPQRFTFPGIIEGASRRYYKREDNTVAPDVRAVSELADNGWTLNIPFGPHYLHAADVLDTPGSIMVDVRRVHYRRKDATAAIVSMARVWHNYWRRLPSDFRNNPVRQTLRKHVEHAIGRMWADKPFDQNIAVIHAGESGDRERPARDAEDWMLGNIEQWLNEWGGFPAMALALSDGNNRSNLESELDDYTFCHLAEDGSFADRLSNGAAGITEATWNAYQDTHYPAALRHGLDTMTVPDVAVSVAQGGTATVRIVPVGGLAPYIYDEVGDTAWLTVGDDGLVTVSPDATVTAQGYASIAHVTDALGTELNVTINITVTTAESE